MQNDLISRQAVIGIIHKEIERTNSYAEHETQINIEMAVKELPTAYNVEKVVAELEELEGKANEYRTDAIELHNEEFWRGRQTGLLKAIGIVRNGGKE